MAHPAHPTTPCDISTRPLDDLSTSGQRSRRPHMQCVSLRGVAPYRQHGPPKRPSQKRLQEAYAHFASPLPSSGPHSSTSPPRLRHLCGDPHSGSLDGRLDGRGHHPAHLLAAPPRKHLAGATEAAHHVAETQPGLASRRLRHPSARGGGGGGGGVGPRGHQAAVDAARERGLSLAFPL